MLGDVECSTVLVVMRIGRFVEAVGLREKKEDLQLNEAFDLFPKTTRADHSKQRVGDREVGSDVLA